jgi:predicted aspartyl protease
MRLFDRPRRAHLALAAGGEIFGFGVLCLAALSAAAQTDPGLHDPTLPDPTLPAIFQPDVAFFPQQSSDPVAGPHSAPMVERYGKPYVMVMVNGNGPFRFVIDTGTGTDAFVTPELADQLGLPVAGQVRLNDPSGQGGSKVPLVLIQSLRVAGVEFTGIKAVRHTFMEEAGQVQGMLGFTLFRNYLLTLDFPNRIVTLGSGRLAPDGESNVFPFRMPDGVPISTLHIDGKPVEAQLDSGGGGLTLPASLAAQLRYEIEPVAFASAESLSTRFQMKAARLASDVQLGAYTFAHSFVEIHPAFPLVNFGSPPMQNFAISFDQQSLLVRFVANRKRFVLTAPPCPMHLENRPAYHPPSPRLVPVG